VFGAKGWQVYVPRKEGQTIAYRLAAVRPRDSRLGMPGPGTTSGTTSGTTTSSAGRAAIKEASRQSRAAEKGLSETAMSSLL
jgi:hypothetical protein